MNPQDPLANLHPLREPLPISWWPPAPGWWVLLLLCLIICAALTFLLVRHHRKNAYRRQALRQLDALNAEYRANGDDGNYLTRVNALLKSVALHAYPAVDIAARHGAAWRSFINNSLPREQQLGEDFDHAVYRNNGADFDISRLQRAAQLWIKSHRVQQ